MKVRGVLGNDVRKLDLNVVVPITPRLLVPHSEGMEHFVRYGTGKAEVFRNLNHLLPALSSHVGSTNRIGMYELYVVSLRGALHEARGDSGLMYHPERCRYSCGELNASVNHVRDRPPPTILTTIECSTSLWRTPVLRIESVKRGRYSANWPQDNIALIVTHASYVNVRDKHRCAIRARNVPGSPLAAQLLMSFRVRWNTGGDAGRRQLVALTGLRKCDGQKETGRK